MRNLKPWGLMALLLLFSTLALAQTPPTPPPGTIPVCDKGSNQTDCLNVPFPEMDDYMYGFEAYIRKAIGDRLAIELANYVTPAQAQSIAQGVVSAALANYSTTAETTTIANNAAAAALQATLVNYSTTSQMTTAINAAITAALQAALANYSTTSQTQTIATNTATTVVNNALANSGFVTAAQAQAIANTAVANALAAYVPSGPGVAKAWWSKNGPKHNLVQVAGPPLTLSFNFQTTPTNPNYAVFIDQDGQQGCVSTGGSAGIQVQIACNNSVSAASVVRGIIIYTQ